MESVLRLFLRNDCKVEKTEVEKQELLSEIRDVSRRLAYNERWFEQECDSDLIDACIYQREELRARYRYLLGLAKKYDLNCAAFQI